MNHHAAGCVEFSVTNMAFEMARFLMLNQHIFTIEFAFAVVAPDKKKDQNTTEETSDSNIFYQISVTGASGSFERFFFRPMLHFAFDSTRD